MLEITLSFQHTDGGQNGVISKDRFFSNRIKDLLYRTRSLHPEHVHDPQFGLGQSSRLSRRPRMPSLDLRRFPRRKVTNSLVADEAPWVARLSSPNAAASLWRGCRRIDSYPMIANLGPCLLAFPVKNNKIRLLLRHMAINAIARDFMTHLRERRGSRFVATQTTL